MKIFNSKLLLGLPVFFLVLASCHECHECHYDTTSGEVELGEYCDDDLEEVEANGYTDTSGTYEVHCHEH